MSANDFFSRWSTRKAEAPAQPETEPAMAPPAAPDLPPPTLEDVAALDHDADFSRFVKPGVDESVRRSAMKKLFTDPHFNVMDGLDIYIDDYNTFEPLPAAMLAMLAHAKPLLDPLGHLQQPAMTMLDRLEQLADGGAPAEADSPAGSAQPVAGPEQAVPETGGPPAAAGQANANSAVDDIDDTAEPPSNPAAPQDDHTI